MYSCLEYKQEDILLIKKPSLLLLLSAEIKIKEAFRELGLSAKAMDLVINQSKTKCKVVGANTLSLIHI